jgi:predicted aconitase with swiveling domain
VTTLLVPGEAVGELVVLESPLSFWGGFDPLSGLITDRSHPQHGVSLVGKIVAMRHGRGSSSSSAVLAESLRLGTGPAALVLGEADQILVTGALVARLLYQTECPIVVANVPPGASGTWRVDAAGVEPE